MHRNYALIAAEFAAIVFGVLLGLALNGWYGASKEAERRDRAETMILAELSANYAVLEEARAYHIRLLPDLVEARNASFRGETGPQVDYRGLGAARLSDVAYQSALATGVFTGMAPDRVAQLSSPYTGMEDLEGTYDRYAMALTELGSTSRGFFDLMTYAFSDSLYGEDEVLSSIAEVLDREPPPNWFHEIDVDIYSVELPAAEDEDPA
ncbi:MAG: hypothetical protein AAFX86_12505 [Pseudomonadota bacterium]